MNMPTRVLSSGARRLATLGATAAVLAGSALAVSPAMASYGEFSGEPDFTGPSTNQVTDDQGGADNGTMLGAYLPSGGVLEGKRVWCSDPGLDWPLATAFNADSARQVVAPDLAYVLWRYDQERGDKSEQMAWDMAISAYLKQSDEIEHRDILTNADLLGSPEEITADPGWNTNSKNIQEVGVSTFNNEVVPAAQENYEEILEAVENRTDQEIPVKAGINLSEDIDSVTVEILDAEDTGASGLEATVTLDNATFADGSTEATYTTGEEAQVFEIAQSAGGEVTASVDVEEAPPTEVTVWRPLDYTDKKSDSPDRDNDEETDGYNRYSIQEVVERNEGTKAQARTAASNSNQPKVVTTINDFDLKAGDEVYDNFTVSGLIGDTTVDVHHELWYSPVKPEQSAEQPENAVKVGELVTEGVGNGDHKTATLTIPEDLAGGWFSWRETIEADDVTDEWSSDYFIPNETGLVEYQPHGETQISETETQSLPIEIHDDGRITGGMPGQVLTVSLEAFQDADGVIEQSPEIPEDATSLGVTTLEVTLDELGNGTYSTGKLGLAEDLVAAGETGAVTIVETLAATDYSPLVVSDYGIPSESIVIDIPAEEEPPAPEPSEEPSEEPTEEPSETPAPETPENPGPGPKVQTGGTSGNGGWYFLAAGAAALTAGGAVYMIRRRSALALADSTED